MSGEKASPNVESDEKGKEIDVQKELDAQKEIDAQKEEQEKLEFRTLLEKEGVVDHLTRAIVALMQSEDKDKPMTFLTQQLAVADSTHSQVRSENEKLKKRVKELEDEVAALKIQLSPENP
eukprot:CAMPEP_0201499106 /NCGR_PEP_ID=MMETSP0151_2-20130828/74492_1 /ASSEMBLY_ACC=CAM_ASM_000257 /TAXON_ID=200890 /ORGANISM="Paramoeba atlantica, Strain 621/1 / CCAP 1560/9" /LENGTH=120 /DNA_ID=CAMNT_0047891175 /DNA_START=49 /DNA_END=411 /DNA_ORIENTATION=-